jgi:hypothetical protein
MLAWLLAACAAGCGPRSRTDTAAADATKRAAEPRKAAQTPRTPPISVSATDLEITIFEKDQNSVVAARVKARSGAVSPNGGGEAGALGTLRDLTATLYQNGKPAATLSADRGTVNQGAGTVVGEGNVRVRSLMHAASPAVRADTMTWRQGENKIFGKGNVLVTREPDLRIPGRSFVADTAIRRFTVQGNGSPATGTLEGLTSKQNL